MLDLEGVIISNDVMEEVRVQLGIELMDFTYYTGAFPATYARRRARGDAYMDTPQALIIRYINHTYPQKGGLSTLSDGRAEPKGRTIKVPGVNEDEGRLDRSGKAIHALCDYNVRHKPGLYFRGHPLDLSKKSHLGIAIGRSHASARRFYDGASSLTNSMFRWVDIVSTHLEYEADLSLLENILDEEATAWGANTDEMLRTGWETRLSGGDGD